MQDPALIAMGLVPSTSDTGSGLPDEAGVASSWRAAWTAIGIGVLVLIGLFWDTASRMVGTWYESDTFNHGFLIVPICGYLVWVKRGALAECVPRPTLWGAALMLAGAFGWLLGHVGNAVSVQQFALVVMIQALFVTVLGPRIARVLAFPLLYLFFAVPFGEFLIPPMQDLTAVFVVAFLRMLDIPVFLDGIFISIPTGNFVVAEACSGVRFLIATLALGFLFAELTYSSRWRRAAFVALSFVVPVVANGFRAFGIVLIAYLTNNELATGVDHIVYGWIFFALVTVILLVIGMTFRDRMPENPVPNAAAIRNAAAGQVAPRRIAIAAAASVAAAILAPVYAAHIDGAGQGPLEMPIVPPTVSGGWTSAGEAFSEWSPVFPGADARVMQSYVKEGRSVQLFIAYYRHEQQGAEMISMRNSLAGDGWSRASTTSLEVMLEGVPHVVESTRMLMRRRGRVTLNWYWVGGVYTANPYYAKLLQAFGRISGRGSSSAVIAVSATYDDTPDQAEARLSDFLSSMAPVRPMLQRLAAE